MADKSKIDQAIENLLDAPASVSSPSGSVTNIRISEAIAADEHLSKKRFSGSPFAAIKRATLTGPRHYGT